MPSHPAQKNGKPNFSGKKAKKKLVTLAETKVPAAPSAPTMEGGSDSDSSLDEESDCEEVVVPPSIKSSQKPVRGPVSTIRAQIKALGVRVEMRAPLTDDAGEKLPASATFPQMPFTDLKVEVYPASHGNPHERSAAYRRLIEVSMLRDLGELSTAKVVDVYGSRRMGAVCSKYGVEHVNGGFGVQYYNDAAKGERVNLKDSEVWGTHALFEDVYHFDAELLRQAISKVTTNTAYVIVRRFVGDMGADTDAEMCWVREKGMIVAYPDHVNPPYPPHPDSEWLFTGVEGALLQIIATSGPFYLIKAIPHFVPPVFNPAPPGEVERRMISTQMYGALVSDVVQLFKGRWRPKDRAVLVDIAVERQLRVVAYSRPMTGSTQTDLRVAVENSTRRSSWAKQFLAHPVLSGKFHEVVEGTWLAMMDGNPTYARQMYALRANQHVEEGLLRASRSHLPPAYDALYKRVLRRIFNASLSLANAVAYGLVFLGIPSAMFPRIRLMVLAIVKRLVSKDVPAAVNWFLKAHAGCMFPKYPLLSFIIENVAYLYSPWTAGVCMAYEYNAKDHGSVAVHVAKFWLGILSEILGGGKLGQYLGTSLHLAWNTAVALRDRKKVALASGDVIVQDLRAAVCSGSRPEREDVKVIPVSLGENYLVPFDPPAPVWTDSTIGALRVRFPDGEIIDVADQSTLDLAWSRCSRLTEERVINNKYIGILMISAAATVFPVDKNACTTLHAIIGRQMTRPNVEDGHPKRFPAWRVVTKIIETTNLWPLHAELAYDTGTFLEETNTITRARVLAGFAAAQEDGYVPPRQSLFVKSDETLAKPRPRAIVSVDPVCQAPLAAVAQALKTLLKNYSPRIWKHQRREVQVWYCSSMTAKELDIMWEQVRKTSYAIVVAGDDSLVVWEGRVFCNDFAKFDASRSRDSIDTLLRAQEVIGIPLIERERQRSLTNYKFTASADGVTFTGEVENLFPTGIVTTTCSNGMDNVHAMAYCFHICWSEGITIEEGFARVGTDLGFVLKIRETPRPHEMDFLKGWWVPTKSGARWINLPSMILKASKVGNPPLKIFSKVTKDPNTAFKHLLFSVSKCWQGIPWEYPLFGALLQKCDQLGLPIANPGSYRAGIVENAVYKPWAEVSDMDWSVVVEMIALRYGVDMDQVVECDTMIRQISSLPCYIAHPVLEAMMRVDYL